MRGLFVTGTGTGVGKTIVSAALLAAMRAAGEEARAHKPVVTGCGEPPSQWGHDHELLGAVTGMLPEQVAPLRYQPAVSPHLAAQLAGDQITLKGVLQRARAVGASGTLVIEGVGGLLVPLGDFDIRDVAIQLGLAVVIVASPALGTINHTLLTLEAARAGGLGVASVVLTPWPKEPSPMERSNRETIAHRGEIEVATLGRVANPDELAASGAELPWRAWL